MFLPISRPSIPGLEIAGMMRPVGGVGGDYYDYVPVNEHTIQVVIADVAGKGVPPEPPSLQTSPGTCEQHRFQHCSSNSWGYRLHTR